MKPEILLPKPSLEQIPVRRGVNVEAGPMISGPELDVGIGAENFGKVSEMTASPSDGIFTTTLPTPVDDPINVAQDTTVASNPLIASDDDLIEKEWVDRAKKIVSETKDNPYKREEAVSKLQVDYIKKRYGRELGIAE